MNNVLETSEASIIRGVTWWGLVVNLLLAGLKIGVGVFAASQALVADGLHSLSDLTSDAAILLGAGYWSEPADASHPYGHGRLETLINVGIGIILAATAIGIGWRAFASVPDARTALSQPMLVLAVAVLAMIAKEWLYRWTFSIGEKCGSAALKSNAWHHRSDALSSIPVATTVVCAQLFPGFHYFDNIAAVIVAAMIAKVAWDIFRSSFNELLENGLDERLNERIRALAAGNELIGEIHAIRSRRVGKALLVDFHMLVDSDMSVKEAHDIAEEFKKELVASERDLTDAVIHIEPLSSSRRRAVGDKGVAE